MADEVNSRVAVLEQIARSIESRFDRLDSRFDRLDGRLDRIEDKVDRLGGRLWTNFYWMLGAFAAVLGVLAHGFHWI